MNIYLPPEVKAEGKELKGADLIVFRLPQSMPPNVRQQIQQQINHWIQAANIRCPVIILSEDIKVEVHRAKVDGESQDDVELTNQGAGIECNP